MTGMFQKIILSAFGFLIGAVFIVSAATNIDSTYHWAWNDVIGWIDFSYYSNVNVTSSKVTGYASSIVGQIAFDCAASPSPDCDPSYGVTHNADGILRGFAWNDSIGWISFICSNDHDPDTEGVQSVCGSYNYGVTIDADGYFNGFAWNDNIGWISFNKNNCDADINGYIDTGVCGGDNATIIAIDYRVKTTANTSSEAAALESSTYDAGAPSAFYTLTYQGYKPAGANVKFQFASSNSSSGPWSFVGPNGQSNTYYTPIGPDYPVEISTTYHNNHRYFRYKIILETDSWKSVGPRIDEVVVGWSK